MWYISLELVQITIFCRHTEDPDNMEMWRRHQMETVSALLALCGIIEPQVTGGFSSQRDSNADFWYVLVVSLNKVLNEHWIDR